MTHTAKWKIILAVVICALSVVYTAPNFFGQSTLASYSQKIAEKKLPDWMPVKAVNLGLDLQGGSHLLLEVDTAAVVSDRLAGLVESARPELRRADIRYTNLGVDGDHVTLTLLDPNDYDKTQSIFKKLEEGTVVTSGPESKVSVAYNEMALLQFKKTAVERSIEIVRRRIDESGTREPVIQQEGEDRIVVQLPGLTDPESVKRLLGKTAKLTFQMLDESADTQKALAGQVPPGSVVLDSAEEAGARYVIKRHVQVGGESLINATATVTDQGPTVSFKFDNQGARRFGDTTKNNVGKRFAIVLDNKVISAPVIREPILGGSGQITGRFTMQEANELALLLRAGALPAPLKILEERTVGATLGSDSVAAGKLAGIVGFGLVVAFMVVSYGLFGIMASGALVLNVAMIFALLSILGATLTLPGIAGIVLTIGMAVDANVLIFERVREEYKQNKRSPISSVDSGYGRAMSTIIDANLTTLIAALFLFSFGTGPVRGFAVTLAIGIVTSLYSAITITRLMVIWWIKRTRPQTIPL